MQYLETDKKEWTIAIHHSEYFNVDLLHLLHWLFQHGRAGES